MLDVKSAPVPASTLEISLGSLTTGPAGRSSPAWHFTPSPLDGAAKSCITPDLSRTSRSAQSDKLGSYYCGARNYDPATAHWTTPDAIDRLDRNLQRYSGNRPVELADPTGLYPYTAYKQALILIDEAQYEADKTINVKKGDISIEVQLMDCECCIDEQDLTKWVREIHDILADGWSTAMNIRKDRDAGGRGWNQFDKNSKERKLLKLFDFWGWQTEAGDETTEAIRQMEKDFDAMVSRLQSEPLKIKCESECDGNAGWVLDGGLWRNGKIIHLCCDDLKKADGDLFRDLLIHELSHSVLKTGHDEDDPITRVRSADAWGDLGRGRTSPFID